MANELTIQQAAAVLATLDDTVEGCRTEITHYGNEQSVESSEEGHSGAPIFEAFYNLARPEAIHSVTNFSAAEFMKIRNHIGPLFNENWPVGQREQTSVTGLSVPFYNFYCA